MYPLQLMPMKFLNVSYNTHRTFVKLQCLQAISSTKDILQRHRVYVYARLDIINPAFHRR